MADSVVSLLTTALCSEAVLYHKSHGFHWLVVGPDFGQLHSLFGDIYSDVFESLDIIGEQIRKLHGVPPYSMADQLKGSILKEVSGPYSADVMIKVLHKDHEDLCALYNHINLYTGRDDVNDLASQQVAIDRLMSHRNFAWRLNAFMGAL